MIKMDFSPLRCGLLLIALWLPVSLAEECNSQRSQQCRSALQDELTRETTQQNQRRTTQTNQRQELQYHCRSLADNLSCLVWQTSNCLSIEERERTSDIINRSWKYLSSVCDAIVGWRISQCFQRDDLRRCESLIRDSSRNANVDNCRKFVAFKECVENIVRYQCPVEDQSVMTLYILDQGREKAWKCSSAETTRYHDDIHYQTLPLSDNGEAQDALCLTRSQSAIRACSDKYYEKIDEARRYRDAQDRMHRECCASIEFERCIRDTIRDYCTLVRNSLVQSILDQHGVRPDPRCRYYGENECSGAASLVATFFLSAFLVVFSSGRGKWF